MMWVGVVSDILIILGSVVSDIFMLLGDVVSDIFMILVRGNFVFIFRV